MHEGLAPPNPLVTHNLRSVEPLVLAMYIQAVFSSEDSAPAIALTELLDPSEATKTNPAAVAAAQTMLKRLTEVWGNDNGQ